MRFSAISYIAKHNRVDLIANLSNVGDCRFSGEFFSILSQSGDLASLAHFSRASFRSAESMYLLFMPLTEAVRNQNLQTLAEYFGFGVAKDFPGAFVEENDLLLFVDNDDCIRRNCDDSGEQRICNWVDVWPFRIAHSIHSSVRESLTSD
jgi:hypothetical protein